MKRNGGLLESLVWHAYEHFFWKWHCNVPVPAARLLSAVNLHCKGLRGNRYYVSLPSPDGSMQLTHPDVAEWRGQLWLAATPYPYSKESYENPCVYRGDDTGRWQPCRGAYPIESINRREIGKAHFSDPALLANTDGLTLFYRKRTRVGDAAIDALYRSVSGDGVSWSTPRVVFESGRHNFISPAVLTRQNGFMMFHIELYSHRQTGAITVRYSGDGIGWSDGRVCQISGLKPDTGVWHIGIARDDVGGMMSGLFVIKNINGDYIGIYRAFSSDEGLAWRMDRKLVLPPVLGTDMKKPYKASFIPGSDEIMISLEDNQGRWFVYRIPGLFEEA